MKFLYFAPILLLFISSCHDNDLPTINVDELNCVYDQGQVVLNYDTVLSYGCPISVEYESLIDYAYSEPVFNPSDSNQMIYLRTDQTGTPTVEDELWMYDFCTGVSTFIYPSVYFGIDWSVKDWIIFTGPQWQIYKIKSNGDSLTQLTNTSNFNNDPKWNDEGNRFIYREESNPSVGLIIADENGAVMDTLLGFLVSNWAWRKNRIVFGRSINSYRQYGYFDLATRKVVSLDSAIYDAANNLVLDIDISKNDILYYSTGRGVFQRSISNSAESREIISGAPNRGYFNFTLSPYGDNIAISRSDLWQIDDCHITYKAQIHTVEISSDGNTERVLEFD